MPTVGRATSLDADESKCETAMANVDVRIVLLAITDGHDVGLAVSRGISPAKSPGMPNNIEHTLESKYDT